MTVMRRKMTAPLFSNYKIKKYLNNLVVVVLIMPSRLVFHDQMTFGEKSRCVNLGKTLLLNLL